jgi:hypothetical protein
MGNPGIPDGRAMQASAGKIAFCLGIPIRRIPPPPSCAENVLRKRICPFGLSEWFESRKSCRALQDELNWACL